MKRRIMVGLMAMGLLGAGTAAAADDESGVDLGLRTGYGIPFGSSIDGKSMSDYVTGQVPIWVDAGYRFTPNVMAGLYFSYGFMGAKDSSCPSGGCSVHDMRFGVQGQYRFSPGESVNPWVGLGVGMEWLGLSESVGSAKVSNTGTGFEFLDLQGGADFAVTDGLAIGPFVSFSLGQYNSFNISCDNVPTGCPQGGGDIQQKALHEWLTLGVRGTYGF